MAKIKTSDLVGQALDWAVLLAAHGIRLAPHKVDGKIKWVDSADGMPWGNGITPFSTRYGDGMPILDRENISVIRVEAQPKGWRMPEVPGEWAAEKGVASVETATEHQSHEPMFQFYLWHQTFGPTRLIAGLRCYVASKLGDEVDVPDELVQGVAA